MHTQHLANPPDWQLSDFDFELPEHLIAQHPCHPRSASRLLDARQAALVDRHFAALPSLLRAGDLMVFNDTQVMKARLFGKKTSGGQFEMLIERVLPGLELHNKSAKEPPHQVAAHLRVSKKPRIGATLLLNGGATATLLSRYPDPDGPLWRLALSKDPMEIMSESGHIPLPPYITREEEGSDQEDYQTIFAQNLGAVAAPTAALHFDASVLAALNDAGVVSSQVTLHVGAGTFQPVKTALIKDHRMHFERYHIPAHTLEAIRACKSRGSRVLAVGTTSVRALESWARTQQASGDTDIFITPGFEFKAVDLLLTNFHLPKSTLLMLVSAFCGFEHMKHCYAHAKAKEYRFFSYGDAMLLEKTRHASSLPQPPLHNTTPAHPNPLS